MARMYGRYLSSTHTDPDWAAMTTVQHDCYMALTSSPDLSWAGVHAYVPSRFAGLASDLTESKVVRTWKALEGLNKLVIDKRTGEVLVRSFIRHDGVLAKPNIVIAFIRAFNGIRSETIRLTIANEVSRLCREERLPERCMDLLCERFGEELGGTIS